MRRALILLGLILVGLGARLPTTHSTLEARDGHTQTLVASDIGATVPVIRSGAPVIPGLSSDGGAPTTSTVSRPAARTCPAGGGDTGPLLARRSTALQARSPGWRSYASAHALERAGRIALRSTAPPASRIV